MSIFDSDDKGIVFTDIGGTRPAEGSERASARPFEQPFGFGEGTDAEAPFPGYGDADAPHDSATLDETPIPDAWADVKFRPVVIEDTEIALSDAILRLECLMDEVAKGRVDPKRTAMALTNDTPRSPGLSQRIIVMARDAADASDRRSLDVVRAMVQQMVEIAREMDGFARKNGNRDPKETLKVLNGFVDRLRKCTQIEDDEEDMGAIVGSLLGVSTKKDRDY